MVAFSESQPGHEDKEFEDIFASLKIQEHEDRVWTTKEDFASEGNTTVVELESLGKKSERVSSVDDSRPVMLVQPGEMMSILKENKKPVASLHFSRCVACVAISENGRTFAHSTENNQDDISRLVEGTRGKTNGESRIILVIPKAEVADLENLSDDSKKLNEDYIRKVKSLFDDVYVQTYRCTDFTPEACDDFMKKDGLPETAIVSHEDSVVLIPMTMGEKENTFNVAAKRTI